jgi:hypothetical protein
MGIWENGDNGNEKGQSKREMDKERKIRKISTKENTREKIQRKGHK